MKVLYLITARGGSKGVPNKNIRLVGGLPLIAYKIIAAQKSSVDKRIIVSTDSDKIADVAIQYGAEVPFMRPEYLASDTASSMDVVMHAIQWIEENDDDKYDYICLLEPSSPFATSEDLDAAIKLIVEKKADTLLGMEEVGVTRNFIHQLDDKGGLSLFYDEIKHLASVRRQEQNPEYTMNGCMYIAKWDYFKAHKLFHAPNSVPYIMPNEKSIEIDSMIDYEFACFLVDKGLIDVSCWKDDRYENCACTDMY